MNLHESYLNFKEACVSGGWSIINFDRAGSLLLVICLLVLCASAYAHVPQTQLDPPAGDPELNLVEEGKSLHLGKLPPQALPADSSHDYDVIRYILDVRLVPAVASNKFRGHVTIFAKSEISLLADLVLDFVGMTVDSCKVNSSTTTFSRTSTKLTVDLDVPYNPGDSFNVEVFYHGNPSTTGGVGFFFTTNGFGTPVYFSFTEPYGSRNWFPCYDWPNDKVLSEIIATVPAGNYAVANGDLISVVDNPDTTTTFHWKENFPIVTYLISLTVCDYARIDSFAVVGSDTIPVSYWVYHEDSVDALTDFKKTPEMIEHFSDIWVPYPFIPEKYSMAQAPIGGAMEHQTNTTWGFSMPGNAANEWVVAHELAHHWWGDMVTCNDFANIWLNEGFASYSEVLWREYEYGDTAKITHLKSHESSIYAARFQSVSWPIYNPPSNYLFGTAVYKKGSWVLHMLRYILGDSLFFNGMADYGQTYMHSTANTEQFKNAMENYSGQDLDWFFDEWVFSPNYPRYNWNWAKTTSGGNYTVYLNINQKQTTPLVFTMPIEFKISTPSGDTIVTLQNTQRDQSFSFQLAGNPTSLTFDPNYWILSPDTLKPYPYLAGDANSDGGVNLSDIIWEVNYVFKGGPASVPLFLADANADCSVNLVDIVYLVNYVFKSGAAPLLGCA